MRYGVTIYDDLYVMQNAHGLIKIGHSGDAEKRRRALERTDRCAIELVLLLPNKGPREEAVHGRLRRHRIEGEWFEGGDDARAAIEKVLNRGVRLEWPFELNEPEAERWLAALFELRWHRYKVDEFRRAFSKLDLMGPGRDADAEIWLLVAMIETDRRARICVSDHDITGWRADADDEVSIPNYSTDVLAARQLWPAGDFPVDVGDALECSMGALRRLLSDLKASRETLPDTRPTFSFSEIE